jgi:replication factor C subunit 1
MFTLKYRPNKIENFIGNKNIIQPFVEWLLEWDPNEKKTKCALVSGVNGVGKSLIVDILLKRHDYNIINLSIDDDRDKETIVQTIKPILKTKKTFDGQENILVVSDIDSSGGDYGFISTLVECIKETHIPIICICDDRYSQNIKPILNYCIDFKLVKPSYDEVYRLIYKVVTNENIKISKQGVDKLYQQSNGDIRFILNSLQLGLKKGDTSKNIQSLNIFDTTGKLFSMETSIDDKVKYYWMAHDIHTLMIQENYINNTLTTKDDVKRLENISYSADSLSDADLFDSVFDFELSKHVALNTIKATSKCNKKGMVKFPQFLGRVSTMNKNKRDKLNYEEVGLFGEKTKEKKETKIKETKIKEPKEKKEPKTKEKKETKIKESKVKEPKPKKEKKESKEK